MEAKEFIQEIAALRGELQRKALQMYEGDSERAEDAVSELFLKLWEQRSQLDQIASKAAYAHTMLRNLIISDVRHRSAERIGEIALPDEGAQPTQHYELRELLRRAIAQLPELRRRIYMLHDIEGYSSEEIAQLLSLRTDAIHNHLSRARRQLKTILTPLVH